MMRNLTDDELDGIAQRAELFFRYDDKAALREEDLADLITEVRELHALRKHLIAMHRQALERLRVLGEPVPADEPPWSPELDPP
jgi:hypothetical protein